MILLNIICVLCTASLLFIMAYSKDDFVNFSDIDNLEEILGDFTESEYNFSDSDFEVEQESKSKCSKSSKNTEIHGTETPKQKLYQCDECDKCYASISGIRGHLRSKHGKQNIKVSAYRKGNTCTDRAEPFNLDRSQFSSTFSCVFPLSLDNVGKNKFRNMKRSVNGQKIIEIVSKLKENDDVLSQLADHLEPMYHEVFNSAASSERSTNESLLEKFHELVYQEDSINEISKICEVAVGSIQTRQFIAVLHRQLITDLIENRASMYKTPDTKGVATTLNDTEQSVILHISGYILYQLKKKTNAIDKEAIQSLIKNSSDSEKSFIAKYSSWTTAINRGGLIVPSDPFFLFIRECEICLRKNVDDRNISKDSFIKAKEIIMEDHMVKFYSEKLLSGKTSQHVIEQCIAIFLNVRGPAVARFKRRELIGDKKDTAKSLRKVLHDKTNSDK